MARLDPNPSGPQTWVGVGTAAAPDALRAGADAAASALLRPDPRLLLVFCSDAYDPDRLLEGVQASAPGVPLIGCSTSGEIATSGPSDSSVVVVAIGGEAISASTGVGRQASSRLREAGMDSAACFEDVRKRPHHALIMLTDGLAGDQQEIVRGAHAVLGSGVPLVGGCAGDDLKMKRTFQLHGGEVLTDAVVSAALTSDFPLGIGVHHGWCRVGQPMLVTRSAGNSVLTLDDEPALDAYLRRLDAPDEARSDPEAFRDYALNHPLGLARRSGEDHVRFIRGADFDARSLDFIAEVPQGGMAWGMEGDGASVLDATDAACLDALAALEGRRPIGVISFDCIARRAVLGERGLKREIERMRGQVGDAPVAGFYTYGEIARTSGMSGFHNQTLVVLALS